MNVDGKPGGLLKSGLVGWLVGWLAAQKAGKL